MADDLMKTVDEKLIEMLTPGLKASIDKLRARGLSNLAIRTFIRGTIDKAKKYPGDQAGELVKLQVDAYLEAK